MAVYTVLEQDQLEAFVEPFGMGTLLDFHGASDGVENTTYFITMDYSQITDEHFAAPERQLVLTLFEQLHFEQLDFYIQLLSRLSEQLPVPAPLRDYNGQALQTLAGKPALLFLKAEGSHPDKPSLEQIASIAHALAQLHVFGANTELKCDNPRSINWIKANIESVLPQVDKHEAKLLQEALLDCQQHQSAIENLPQGIIHNDLFRDNVLFLDNTLTAIIDFYNAGTGNMLMDLAICVNDWCWDGNTFDAQYYRTFLQHYSLVRPLSEAEKPLWAACLRIAALRFWSSRRASQFNLQASDGLHINKNPVEYQKRWESLQQQPPAL